MYIRIFEYILHCVIRIYMFINIVRVDPLVLQLTAESSRPLVSELGVLML